MCKTDLQRAVQVYDAEMSSSVLCCGCGGMTQRNWGSLHCWWGQLWTERSWSFVSRGPGPDGPSPLWQVELPQLQQKELPMCSQHWRLACRLGAAPAGWVRPQQGGCGPSRAGFFLKSAIISTVVRALSSSLFCLHQDTRGSISHLCADSSPSEMSPMRVVSSLNFRSFTVWWPEAQQLVYREERRNERIPRKNQPCVPQLSLCNLLSLANR